MPRLGDGDLELSTHGDLCADRDIGRDFPPHRSREQLLPLVVRGESSLHQLLHSLVRVRVRFTRRYPLVSKAGQQELSEDALTTSLQDRSLKETDTWSVSTMLIRSVFRVLCSLSSAGFLGSGLGLDIRLGVVLGV